MNVLRAPDGPDSPFCLPDWRWRSAEYLVDCGRRVCRRRDDQQVREAVQYLRHLRRCQGERAHQRLARRYPALYLAHSLYGAPTFQRWELEARLLTPEPLAVVGRKCGLTEEVVGTYHDVFFDVRPHLHARDWITNRVLGRRAHVGLEERDVGLILKIYALTGGSLAVDALVDYHKHPPVVPERPELLAPQEMEALRLKLLIWGSILARTLPVGGARALKKMAVLQHALEVLRSGGGEGGAALAGPLRAAIGLPHTPLTAIEPEVALLAQAMVTVA
jgi:hypothetical protein